MREESPLVNRVEQSGIVVIDLEQLIPTSPIESIDLKQFLVNEMVLMEKPFREALKKIDWTSYKNKIVGVYCSNDALIPMWAYMLMTAYLTPYAVKVESGSVEEINEKLILEAVQQLDIDQYRDGRIMIKGCGNKKLSSTVYIAITQKLLPVVKTLMYGEPCSSVPVYKKPKQSA